MQGNSMYQKSRSIFLFFFSICLCAFIPAQNKEQKHEPISDNPMQDTLLITYKDSTYQMTIGGLKQLKLRLIQALKQHQPEAYDHLIKELQMYSQPFLTDSTAFIGRWRLRTERESLWLEHQQMPRAPLMLFHLAELVFADGQWKVKKITYKKVWKALDRL